MQPLVLGLVLLHDLVPCRVLHLLIVLHLLFALILLIVLLIMVHQTQDLDKGKYVNKFISTKYGISSPCATLNSSRRLLLLEELP
jgi:heme A synthase